MQLSDEPVLDPIPHQSRIRWCLPRLCFFPPRHQVKAVLPASLETGKPKEKNKPSVDTIRKKVLTQYCSSSLITAELLFFSFTCFVKLQVNNPVNSVFAGNSLSERNVIFQERIKKTLPQNKLLYEISNFAMILFPGQTDAAGTVIRSSSMVTKAKLKTYFSPIRAHTVITLSFHQLPACVCFTAAQILWQHSMSWRF